MASSFSPRRVTLLYCRRNYGASNRLERAAAGSNNPTKFSEVWTVASRNSLYQILAPLVSFGTGAGAKMGLSTVSFVTANFVEFLFHAIG
jgi:hypothetical protein